MALFTSIEEKGAKLSLAKLSYANRLRIGISREVSMKCKLGRYFRIKIIIIVVSVDIDTVTL